MTDLIKESSTKSEEGFRIGSKYPTSAESLIVRGSVKAFSHQLLRFVVVNGIYMYIGWKNNKTTTL